MEFYLTGFPQIFSPVFRESHGPGDKVGGWTLLPTPFHCIAMQATVEISSFRWLHYVERLSNLIILQSSLPCRITHACLYLLIIHRVYITPTLPHNATYADAASLKPVTHGPKTDAVFRIVCHRLNRPHSVIDLMAAKRVYGRFEAIDCWDKQCYFLPVRQNNFSFLLSFWKKHILIFILCLRHSI